MLRKIFSLKVIIPLVVIFALWYGISWFRDGIHMPGRSYSGLLDPLELFQQRIRDNLKTHVDALAVQIGERNLNTPGDLERAADYIHHYLEQQEYSVVEETYAVDGKNS